MITKEMILDVLKDMNLRPKVDEDGDINVRYRLRHLLLLFDTHDEHDGYIQVIMPRIYPLTTQDEQMCALYVCNKLTRESKHVKVWITEEMDDIFASSEFFANTKRELAIGLKNGLDLLSTISYVIKQNMVNYLTEQVADTDTPDDTELTDDADDSEFTDSPDTDVA